MAVRRGKVIVLSAHIKNQKEQWETSTPHAHQWKGYESRNWTRTQWNQQKLWTKWIWQISIEHFILKQKNTPSSAPHGTFSKTDHIIGHKTGLNRYKKIEIISCILSDHHGLRLFFSNNKNNKIPHTYGSWTMPYSMTTWSRKK